MEEIFRGDTPSGIFISNSAHEGSSNSLHEAVAAGFLPLVSDSVKEIFDIIRPCLLKDLVTDGTARSIAIQIQKLLDDESQTARLKSECLEDFIRYWDRQKASFQEAAELFVEMAQGGSR